MVTMSSNHDKSKMLKTIIKSFIPASYMDARRHRQLEEKNITCRNNFYHELLGENIVSGVIIDIGANQGNRIDAFIQFNGSIIALEPQTSRIKYLEERYKKNKNIIIVGKAVGKKEGKLTLRSSTDKDVLATTSEEFIEKTQLSGRFESASWDFEETVDTTTLDLLIAEYRMPDFVKIDVEGAELDVLLGLNQAVPCLSFEYTPEVPDKMKACVERCNLLGMTSFNISFGESMKMSFTQWKDAEAIYKVIDALEDNNYLFGDIYARIDSN